MVRGILRGRYAKQSRRAGAPPTLGGGHSAGTPGSTTTAAPCLKHPSGLAVPLGPLLGHVGPGSLLGGRGAVLVSPGSCRGAPPPFSCPGTARAATRRVWPRPAPCAPRAPLAAAPHVTGPQRHLQRHRQAAKRAQVGSFAWNRMSFLAPCVGTAARPRRSGRHFRSSPPFFPRGGGQPGRPGEGKGGAGGLLPRGRAALEARQPRFPRPPSVGPGSQVRRTAPEQPSRRDQRRGSPPAGRYLAPPGVATHRHQHSPPLPYRQTLWAAQRAHGWPSWALFPGCTI